MYFSPNTTIGTSMGASWYLGYIMSSPISMCQKSRSLLQIRQLGGRDGGMNENTQAFVTASIHNQPKAQAEPNPYDQGFKCG